MRLGPESAWIKRIFTPAALGTLLAVAALPRLLWAAQGQSLHLCDFEDIPMAKWSDKVYDIPTALKKPTYPSNDYDWNTGGYARIQPAEKIEAYRVKNEALGKFMRGKYAALVRFSVPAQYRVLGGDDDPKTWETGMTLSTETPTRLPITDWSPYKSLSLDVYNPADQDRELFVRISDAESTTLLRSSTLKPGAATVQIPLAELDRQRLNVSDIRAVTLYLDTVAMETAPEMYFDNLQLNTEILEAYKATGDEDEEEFEFEEEEEEELSEEALRKYGGRLEQAPLSK